MPPLMSGNEDGDKLRTELCSLKGDINTDEGTLETQLPGSLHNACIGPTARGRIVLLHIRKPP